MDLNIKEIKLGNNIPIHDIYKEYRNSFICWAVNKFSCSEEEAKDAFQDVVFDFYCNVVNNKLEHLNCDLRTYLFALGKYKLLNVIKKSKHFGNFLEFELINKYKEELYQPNFSEMKQNEEYNKEIVQQYLNQLPEEERRILEMYYIEEKDLRTIAVELGLNSANTAKKKKFDTLRKLGKLAKSNLKIWFILAGVI